MTADMRIGVLTMWGPQTTVKLVCHSNFTMVHDSTTVFMGSINHQTSLVGPTLQASSPRIQRAQGGQRTAEAGTNGARSAGGAIGRLKAEF